MNVTAANALGVLEEWETLVNRCEFYTVDQEMTGITGKEPLNRDGTLDDHYENVRHAVEKYEAFQYGICLFERKDKKNITNAESAEEEKKELGTASEYIVRPFSFWLFRSDADVSFEGRAVKFLLKNHMNFQFWMENGFAYGNTDVNACPNYESLNDAEKKWVAEKFAAISEWYDNVPSQTPAFDSQEPSLTLSTPSLNFADPASPTTPALTMVSASATPATPIKDEYCLDTFVSYRADVYLHYLLYAQTKHIPDGHVVPAHIKEKDGRKDVFNALPSKSLLGGFREPSFCRVWFNRLGNNSASSSGSDEEKEINAISIPAKPTFYPFFKTLVESKKPHIGHNYFTDLMFQINQHHSCPSGSALPDSYQGFKKLVGELFPTIYDTKVLLSLLAVPMKNSSLGFAYAEAKARVRKQRGKIAKKFHFPMGFNDYSKVEGSGSAVAHDGAYDAFMTGVVFLFVLATSSPSNNAVNNTSIDEEGGEKQSGRPTKRRLAEVVEDETSKHLSKTNIAVATKEEEKGDETSTKSKENASEKFSFEGIPEGYATYEGVIAQFASKYWMALRRSADDVLTSDLTAARETIMSLEPALPPTAPSS